MCPWETWGWERDKDHPLQTHRFVVVVTSTISSKISVYLHVWFVEAPGFSRISTVSKPGDLGLIQH